MIKLNQIPINVGYNPRFLFLLPCIFDFTRLHTWSARGVENEHYTVNVPTFGQCEKARNTFIVTITTVTCCSDTCQNFALIYNFRRADRIRSNKLLNYCTNNYLTLRKKDQGGRNDQFIYNFFFRIVSQF